MFVVRARASAVLTVLFLGLVPVAQTTAAERTAPPAAGRTRQLPVAQVFDRPRIDGSINETVWAEAEVASDFWISEYGRRPSERTDVRVVMDDAAIYLAFTCRDSQPENIRANQD